jgi:hypothetical protein
MAGIKETKEAVTFVARMIDAADKSLADGKITIFDAANLFSPLQALPAAIGGLSAVPSEMADLDPGEAEELRALVAAELDLTNDAAEIVAENIIGFALQFLANLEAVRSVKATPKEPMGEAPAAPSQE